MKKAAEFPNPITAREVFVMKPILFAYWPLCLQLHPSLMQKLILNLNLS
jgi:hypothetical protein